VNAVAAKKRSKVLVVEDHDGLRAAIAAISRPANHKSSETRGRVYLIRPDCYLVVIRTA
jgi:hypothetical protein